jgi:predicted GNAT superfamily acetyltransferase
VEYLPNFYGGMQDVINGADDSDRLLVRWRLNSPRVIAASAGSPRLGNAAYERSRGAVVALGVSATGAPAPGDIHGGISLVAIPTDIERMRLSDPHRAGEWRTAVRRALFALMAEGARVVGFDRDGWYILDSPGGAPLSPGPQSVATKGTES